MSEEFQESEIIFSDEYFMSNNVKSSNKENTKRKPMATGKKSSPVRIPSRTISPCKVENEEEEQEERMTPPHVIIRKRRKEAQMAYSFCTLKGRDLSRHRNSVLRMTGFLEV
ncbi:AtS40-3 [Raphanus sativus]|uniref:Protein S40-3 n=1 Tax=Raphanus sativus TaxID=3726 RepID=A0A6J0MB58_RAPSA|nr:protein S40-3 [Raphanus sativus]KAJ4912643.1 AtS40-3 [Raphanus sativus]